MPCNVLTFLGFASLLAWLQTSDYLCLARDAAVHNGSLAACAVFAIVLLLYGLLNRLLAREPRRGFLLGTAVAASMCGIAYALVQGDGARLLFFCGQMACGALLVVSWGERLALLPYRTLMPLVASAGLCSAAVLFACSSAGAPAAAVVVGALPGCSGLCLFALAGTAGGGMAGDRAVNTASSDSLAFEPIEREALRRMPWMLVVVLCLCTFAASLFGGLATNPYLTNSHAVTTSMLSMTAAGLLCIGGGGWLCLSHGDGDERRPLLLLQLMAGLALILLVGGLLLFSVRIPGTMTFALGMVLSAKNCLVMLCWIVFARAVADARLPFIPCFALLILASGALYVPYLGAYVNKSTGIGFGALTSTATATIAFVAVLAVLYMVVRMRQLGAGQRQAAAPEPAEPLSLEDIRNALRAHREGMMVPYGLTEREREIALMILDGQTMGGIAEQLFITERTVKFHSKNAYEKLGVHSKKELMQMFSEL